MAGGNKMKNEEFRTLYKGLLNAEYKGKEVWKYFKNSGSLVLTSAPHFVGELYEENNNFKLMVVGRAVNGWKHDFESCSNSNDILDCILNQTFTFEDVIKEEGIKEETTYFYSKSPFGRLIRKLLESYGEGENYHKKILWSNLYKIAPRNGGNPGWRLIKSELQTYIDIVKKEIDIYKPTHILFVTDIDYFNHYELNSKYPRFGEQLEVEEIRGFNFVVAKGKYNHSKIIVCKRPEFRNTDDMVKEIKKVFEEDIK